MRPTVHLIPHTHWDREWYLTAPVFRARLVELVDRTLDLLEQGPGELSFLLDGQTALLEDYLLVRPEARDRVTRLVREGRLVSGPWYILADEQIPTAESAIRNLLLGGADADRLGRRMPVLYSPDAFGHPPRLPTLAAEFGLAGAVLWRGLGPRAAGGKDLFRWIAEDGRAVTVYHLPPEGYEIGSELFVAESELPRVWPPLRERLLTRAATREVALMVGADHHAPDRRLAILTAQLSRIDPSCDFRLSTLEGFFTAVAVADPRLAEVRGELRESRGHTWALQGVHGTRAPFKRRHARVELALVRLVEPLAALAPAAEGSRQAVLRRVWRELVQCQFHDTLAGTVSDPVARHAAVRLEGVAAQAREITHSALHAILGQDADLARDRPSLRQPALALWNPAARPRAGVILADLTFFRRDVLVGPPGSRRPRTAGPAGQVRLVSDDGTPLPVQMMGWRRGLERLDARRHHPEQAEVDVVRLAMITPPVPPLGFAGVRPGGERSAPVEEGVRFEAGRLTTDQLEAWVARDGRLSLRRLPDGPLLTGLCGFETERDRGDSYTPWVDSSPTRLRVRGRIRPQATGPLVGELAWECGLGGRGGADPRGPVTVHSQLQLRQDEPFLRLRLTVDNRRTDHRLRLRIPVGLSRLPAVAGTQFGQISRAASPRPARDRMEAPIATAPAHRYVAAARGARGVAVLSPGFFEYEWTRGGDLVLTLLRSVGQLSRGDVPTRPGHAGWPTDTPDAQCQGLDVVDVVLAPIAQGDLDAPGRLDQLWEDAFAPIQPFWIRDAVFRAVPDVGVTLEGRGLVLSAVKPSEDGAAMVLRCFNAAPDPSAGAWTFARPIRAAFRALANEQRTEGITLENDGRRVAFTAGPHELATVIVEPG